MKTQVQRSGVKSAAAFWRGDLVVFWVILIVWSGIIAAAAYDLDVKGHIPRWLGLFGALIVSWLAATLILIRRTAVSDRDIVDAEEGGPESGSRS